MKKYLLFALPLLLLLATGCPVGLDHPLSEPGSEKIDDRLIGTWNCSSSESEVQRVKIAKESAKSYKVSVLERGELYSLETDDLAGYVTSIKEKNFVYFKPDGAEQYYHYCYWLEGQNLITCDVSLLDGGLDAVTDTKSLRDQVERSMVKEAWGDETLEWIKEKE